MLTSNPNIIKSFSYQIPGPDRRTEDLSDQLEQDGENLHNIKKLIGSLWDGKDSRDTIQNTVF